MATVHLDPTDMEAAAATESHLAVVCLIGLVAVATMIVIATETTTATTTGSVRTMVAATTIRDRRGDTEQLARFVGWVYSL